MGSAPASGAVFRALAENPERTKQSPARSGLNIFRRAEREGAFRYARDGRAPRFQNSELTEDFSLAHITRHVEQLDLIDRLEVRVIVELPHDFLVASDFKELRLLAHMAVAKITDMITLFDFVKYP